MGSASHFCSLPYFPDSPCRSFVLYIHDVYIHISILLSLRVSGSLPLLYFSRLIYRHLIGSVSFFSLYHVLNFSLMNRLCFRFIGFGFWLWFMGFVCLWSFFFPFLSADQLDFLWFLFLSSVQFLSSIFIFVSNFSSVFWMCVCVCFFFIDNL